MPRRLLVVLGLSLALVGLTVGPAAAAFSSSVSLTSSVTTATVAAPGDAKAAVVLCGRDWLKVYTGSVSWTPSNAADVTGYTVRQVSPNGSSTVAARAAADATSALVFGTGNGKTYRYSITTETAYGWTATSGLTAAVTC